MFTLRYLEPRKYNIDEDNKIWVNIDNNILLSEVNIIVSYIAFLIIHYFMSSLLLTLNYRLNYSDNFQFINNKYP